MPKLQIKATELVGTEVGFVSLVKRGANRIPFRITKEDTEMLDLHKIGRSLFKKADPLPEVVAAIVSQGTDTTALASLFKAHDLDPAKFVKREKDGVVAIAKADAEAAENTVLLKLDDEVTLVVANVTKGFAPWKLETTSFDDAIATNAVRPMIWNASDALSQVISAILDDASSAADAATAIGTAIDAYKEYVTSAFDALPEQVFKMDQTWGKTKKGKKKPADAGDADDMKKGDANAVPTSGVNVGGAGLNGTGAGAELGKGTGTSPRASEDDAENTPATLGGCVGVSTNGNEDPGVLAVHKEDGALPGGMKEPEGFMPGDPDGFGAAPTDSDEATARASADDKKENIDGGTGGSSIPDGEAGMAVHKNDGDSMVGKKPGKNQVLPDDESGSGAQAATGQDLKDVSKTDNSEILAAIASFQKSIEDKFTEVHKQVGELKGRLAKAEEAVNGTVFAEPGADVPTRTQKSDANAIPLLDTGLTRG